MPIATATAPTNASVFRQRAIRQPRNRASTGKVATPTIIRVVMNAASTGSDAPLARSTAASG